MNHQRHSRRNNKRRRSSCSESQSRHRKRERAHSTSASSSRSSRSDDERDAGHYKFRLGESITSRYKVLRQLGDGTFGRVLECWDRKRERIVALKIIRPVKRYTEAAKIEAEILMAIREKDLDGSSRCVQLLNWFDYRGHMCIVTEKLGMSLYDMIKKNEYQGFSMRCVQSFGRQILEALKFLHGMKLTHTDLKPENVLLVKSDYDYVPPPRHVKRVSDKYREPVSTEVRIIDFGGATFESDHHSSIINTRQYRAPEVILGLGWSYPSDIWSVGCILMELYSGELLFPTHDNLEHLAMFEKLLGPIPESMVARADRSCAKYFADHRLNWPNSNVSRESERAVRKLPLLEEIADVEHSSLANLVRWLLTYEPDKRPTAAEALSHDFFKQQFDRRE